MSFARAAVMAVVVLLALPASTLADPTITEFTTGLTPDSGPNQITAGPDGNLWFTESDIPARIGRITPTGEITEFTAGLDPYSGPTGIVAGPDGNLWFTEFQRDAIGRITPTGEVTEFSAGLTRDSGPRGIALGPDGNLWFTEYWSPGRIGRITPTGEITEFSAGLSPGQGLSAIVAGPDGNLWFTEPYGHGAIGRITPTGEITEFTSGLISSQVPTGIAAGPDGNLWFTENGSPGGIGRITPTGEITEFNEIIGNSPGLTMNSGPYWIAAGPDCSLWFTENSSPGRIGRITPAGRITEFTTGLTPNSAPFGITLGPDGNLWFTEINDPGRIGRITEGPGAETGTASDVTTSTATLAGTVCPNSKPTSYHFEYGTTSDYGAATPTQGAGQEASRQRVEATLSGLTDNTTYHYRLVATSDSNTTFGGHRTFTTADDPGNNPDPGSDPGPAPNSRPVDNVPPAEADLAGSPSSVRVNRRRRFKFGFSATEGLTGKIAFKSLAKVQVSRKRKVTLARKAFTVPGNGDVKLRIRMSKKNFRILKLNRRIRTLATVTLEDPAGLTSQARKRVKLKAPRPR